MGETRADAGRAKTYGRTDPRSAPEVAAKADAIRKVGNVAVHESRGITPQTALNVLRQLHDVLKWAAFTYSAAPDDVPTAAAYDPSLIPAPAQGGQPPLSTAELNQLLATFEAKDTRWLSETMTRKPNGSTSSS